MRITCTSYIVTDPNSSGYASVEPLPYITSSAADSRKILARGGLYTPAKVAYSKVQVVKNYSPTTPNAPYGYTVYDFTHSGNSSSGNPSFADYYPNAGTYGDIDYSWQRGFLTNMASYDKNNNCISQKKMTYNFIEYPQDPHVPAQNIFSPKEQIYNTIGWAKLTQVDEKVNGVTNTKKLNYADDLNTSPDKIVVTTPVVTITEPWASGAVAPHFTEGFPQYGIGAYTMSTVGLGTSGAPAHILALPFLDDDSHIQIFIAPNLGLDDEDEADNTWYSMDRNINVTTFGINFSYNLIGIGQWRYSTNDNELFVFFAGNGKSNSSKANVICVILKNLTLNNDGHYTYDQAINYGGRFSFDFTNLLGSGQNIISCSIGNQGSNTYPTVVFLEGDVNNLHTNQNRQIFYAKNLSDPNGSITFPNVTASPKTFVFPGNRIWLNYSSQLSNSPLSVEITGADWNSTNNHPLHHTIIDYFDGSNATLRSNVPDYLLLGDVGDMSTAEVSPDFRYFGMFKSPAIQGSGERDNLILVRQKGYPTVPNQPPRPCLTIAKVGETRTDIYDLDGQPNQIIETNSNGQQRMTTPIPAYWNYGAMLTSHMLTQPCQSIIYENPYGSNVVRSASTTTWTNTPSTTSPGVGLNILEATTWVPWQSYAWKDPNDGTGYNDFFTSSSNWKLTNTIIKYNQNNQVLMTQPPLGRSTTINMRNDIGVPIGTINGAHFDECGVFTGDYDLSSNPDNTGYFDKANGWEKRSAVVSSTMPHFGEKSLCLNSSSSSGPARYFRIDQGDDYIVSAWVNVTGSLSLYYSYNVLLGSAVPFSSEGTLKAGQPLTISATQGWQLIKIKIPASTDLTSQYWTGGYVPGIGIWFDNNSNSAAYIDDIRFYPSKSLVTTTYYDSKWQQPIVSVDPSNNPGKVTVYDDFGRATEVRKINKNNPVQLDLMSENIIHLAGEQQVFPDPDQTYKIVFNGEPGHCIDIEGNSDSWNIGSNIHLWTYFSGSDYQPNQEWQFVPIGNGYYNIVCLLDVKSLYINNPQGSILTGTIPNVVEAGTVNLAWKLIPNSDGSYTIVSKVSPRVAITLNGNPTDGATVQLSPTDGSDSQKWQIVPAD